MPEYPLLQGGTSEGTVEKVGAHDVSYEPWDEDNSLRYDSTDGSSVI